MEASKARPQRSLRSFAVRKSGAVMMAEMTIRQSKKSSTGLMRAKRVEDFQVPG
tara:strand:- start:938 stop:1099 length:162 start_codon:yes stop_codon:yes gene_type:complete